MTPQILAVVDGDENADVYGYATTVDEALSLASSCFVDRVARIECYGPIRLADGRLLAKAFVAFTC